MRLFQIEVLLIPCQGAEYMEQELFSVGSFFKNGIRPDRMIQQVIRAHLKKVSDPDQCIVVWLARPLNIISQSR